MLSRKVLPRTATYGVISVLTAAFLFQAIASMWNDAPTFDELVNPSVGYAELRTRDFGLVNDHPPFYRIFLALPLLVFQPILPLDHDSWQKRRNGVEDRYDFAGQFFYVANGDADRMLFWSRIIVIFLSVLLGLLVFIWARELYGDGAGLFALFLYSFEPNIIAHSRLTTNDLVVTLFIFATIYQFWQYSNRPSLQNLMLTGALLGLALLSKFSALILVPMLLPLGFLVPCDLFRKLDLGRIIPRKRHRFVEATGRVSMTMFFLSVIAVGVILIFYGSQWRLFTQGLGNAVNYYHEGRSAFLMGNHSATGWWYYFPLALVLKTPIPFLVYILVALLLLSFRKDKAGYFLLVPVGVILSAALFSHMNIGIRHILPVYPFLIVLASSITRIRFSHPRFFFGCFGCLALWYFTSTLSIFPSYLAYFNEFVGPRGGYRMLVDSNLDWGQDLKRLKQFMDSKGIRSVYLSYFGTADPCYYGMKFKYLPSYPESFLRCSEGLNNPPIDAIAISATNLQSVYFSDKSSFEWLKGYKPMAQIGYSIFVYDIRADPLAHTDLGILYMKYGMLESALMEFKLVAELAPAKSTAHSNLGFAYAQLRMLEEAQEAYKKALVLDPNNSSAKEGLRRPHLQQRENPR